MASGTNNDQFRWPTEWGDLPSITSTVDSSSFSTPSSSSESLTSSSSNSYSSDMLTGSSRVSSSRSSLVSLSSDSLSQSWKGSPFATRSDVSKDPFSVSDDSASEDETTTEEHSIRSSTPPKLLKKHRPDYWDLSPVSKMQRTLRTIEIDRSPKKKAQTVISAGMKALRQKPNVEATPERFRRAAETLNTVHRRLDFDPTSYDSHEAASTILKERTTIRSVVEDVSGILKHSHPDPLVLVPSEVIDVSHIDAPTVREIQSGDQKKIKVTGFHRCPLTDPRYQQLFNFIAPRELEGPYVASFTVEGVLKQSTFFPAHFTKDQMVQAIGSATVFARFNRRKIGQVPASSENPVSFWVEQLIEPGMKASVYPLYFCEAIRNDQNSYHRIRPDQSAYSGDYLFLKTVKVISGYIQYLENLTQFTAQKEAEEKALVNSIRLERSQYHLEQITKTKQSERKQLRIKIDRETRQIISQELQKLAERRPTLAPQENPVRYVMEGFLDSQCVVEIAKALPELEIAKGIFVRVSTNDLLKGLKQRGMQYNGFNQKTLTFNG